MTHDELIMKLWEKRNAGCDHLDIHFVLSAVVELHKPASTIVDGVKGVEWCYQCADQRGYAKYPCPTIQAIEEQLK